MLNKISMVIPEGNELEVRIPTEHTEDYIFNIQILKSKLGYIENIVCVGEYRNDGEVDVQTRTFGTQADENTVEFDFETDEYGDIIIQVSTFGENDHKIVEIYF